MRSPLRMLLYILSLLYAAGFKLHRALYTSGLRKRHRFGTPVIGVGNVECGGTGKTPTTCDLALRYLREGLSVAVVVSGYKKPSKQALSVVSCDTHEDRLTVSRSLGDEGAEIYATLNASIQNKKAWVIAARPKWKGVAWAEKAFRPDVILVDDALQHHALICKKMIIVASTPEAVVHGNWLPYGYLREKLDFRASTQDETQKQTQRHWVWTQVHRASTSEKLSADAITWYRDYSHIQRYSDQPLEALETVSCKKLEGRSFHLLTAIARPEIFFRECEIGGVHVESTHAFPDHHVFSKSSIQALVQSCPPASDWLVTLKDAVKLKSEWFSPASVYVLRAEPKWNRAFSQQMWPWLQEGVCAS